MKTMISMILLTTFVAGSYAQNIDLKDAYLERSKNQRLAGYITLGIGAATLLPGVVILANTEPGLDHLDEGLKGSGLAAVGIGCIGASIILFIKANQNEKRANRISLQLNDPVPITTGLVTRTLPYSVGLRIRI